MADLITNNTTNSGPLKLTVHPEPEQKSERSLSPYQQRMASGYDFVNNDFLGTGGISFKSVLDTVNPLQQLPVISTAYREISGDSISTGARLIGGALMGGPLGFALALVNEMVSGATGNDIGGNLYAAITDKYKASEKLT